MWYFIHRIYFTICRRSSYYKPHIEVSKLISEAYNASAPFAGKVHSAAAAAAAAALSLQGSLKLLSGLEATNFRRRNRRNLRSRAVSAFN